MTVLPIARRDPDSAPFFDGTARGELLVKLCPACATYARPDALMCPACGSPLLGWATASGNASLVSWAVVHTKPDRAGVVAPPSVIGLVELEEGPWLHAALIDLDLGTAHAGLALVAEFVDAGEEKVPVFGPRGPTEPGG